MSTEFKHAVSRKHYQLTFADYLRLARYKWRLVAAVALVVLACSFAYFTLAPKKYEAYAEAAVVPSPTSASNQALIGDVLAKSKAKAYVSLAKSPIIAQKMSEESSAQLSAGQIQAMIDAAVPADSNVIRVVVRADTGPEAKNFADAYVRTLIEQVSDIEVAAHTFSTESAVSLVPLAPAMEPDRPKRSEFFQHLPFTIVFGVALGLLTALFSTRADRRVRAAEDLELAFKQPVLSRVPTDAGIKRAMSPLGTAGPSEIGRASADVSEALAELRTNLQFANVDAPPRVITVTSSLPAEGKSSIAAGLAVSLAGSGIRVVLLDGDLRRPTIARIFGLIGDIGVTDILSGRATIDDVLQPWGVNPALSILGSGARPPNASELLSSEAMNRIVTSLSANAMVIIDAPPLLPVTDAAILAEISDGAIVVVRADRTELAQVKAAAGRLEKVNARMLGFVLNMQPSERRHSAYSVRNSLPAGAHFRAKG